MSLKVERRTAEITAIGTALAIAGAVTALLGWNLPDTFQLSRAYSLISSFLFSAVISGILIHRYLSPVELTIPQPKILKYIAQGYMLKGGFLITDKGWLGPNLIYTVVLEEDQGFERILGIAQYIMTQDNGLIQLSVLARSEMSEFLWNRLDSGETDQLKNIRIKVGTPSND
jgi:hypothetical protein